MKIIEKIDDLKGVLATARHTHKSIGLVPTMGALHAGHRALVAHAVAENDVTVVSIFVNPTQFNDKNDLKNYPRTPEADCELLANAGVNIVFMPSAEEMYPAPDTRQFEFGALATVMEGAFRPGHFNGVAQIVSRLFEIAAPDRAYFGEKDFQQLAIIREMVRHLQLDVQIVACPIVREADGLAMSSRNARLTAAQRQAAVNISRVLLHSRELRVKPAHSSCHCELDPQSLESTRQWVTEQVNAVPELQVEYFAIVDGTTLQPIENWADSAFPVGCIAVFDGDVRLIDTVFYA
ncbi:pantoate-beta-alanine ligase [Candidatus Symbiothrix dinenymphae]|nr:pantoate-beta-alanine ligase [Candidatus Symbiothrix dinenymphae]